MSRSGGKILITTLIAIAALALAPFGALADDPIPTTLTVAPSPAPSGGPVTVTTTTTAGLSTTAPTLSSTTTVSVGSTPTSSPAPPVQITSSQPISGTTTTTVAPTTTTPVVTTADVSGPGTSGTGTAGVSTTAPTVDMNVDPSGPPNPNDVGVPGTTTSPDLETHADHSVDLPSDTSNAITAQLDAGTTRTDEDGEIKSTDVEAAVSDPKSGVALSARATAALCLLSKALASTDLTARPITTATLSTLCKDDPSTAGGSLSATLPGIASGTIDANAAICLIAKAAGLPSKDVSSKDAMLDPVATATIRAACTSTGTGSSKDGPFPDTLATSGDVDVPSVGPTSFDTAAAVCLLGVASGGIPTTASVSSLCGVDGAADHPGAGTPSTGDVTVTGDLPGAMPDATLHATVCTIASALAGQSVSVNVADACAGTAGPGPAGATPESPVTVGGPESSPRPAADGPAAEGPATGAGAAPAGPGGAAAGAAGMAQGEARPSGLPAGLTQLPSTSTSASLGAFALIGLAGLAALRRRMK